MFQASMAVLGWRQQSVQGRHREFRLRQTSLLMNYECYDTRQSLFYVNMLIQFASDRVVLDRSNRYKGSCWGPY